MFIHPEGEAVTRKRAAHEEDGREREAERERRRKTRKDSDVREQQRVEEASLDRVEAQRREREAREERDRRRGERDRWDNGEVNVESENNVEVEVDEEEAEENDAEAAVRENAEKLRIRKEETEKGIPVMLPTNLQELLTPVAVIENISERALEMVVAGVYRLAKPIVPDRRGFNIKESPGVELTQVRLSHASSHRDKLRAIEQVLIKRHYCLKI